MPEKHERCDGGSFPRTSKRIMDEIAALDAESAKVLKKIRELV
jgi:hypothetical protein